MISITDGLKCYYNSNMKEKTPLELERENRILQSNWNSLREFVIQLQKLKGINQQGFSWGVAQEVLDKMNELEGKDKE